MTSLEIELQEKELKKTGGFTFTWSIHNFSHCALKQNYNIASPEFAVEFLGGMKLKLYLYPKGFDTQKFISCYIGRVGLRHSESCAVAVSILILKSNGTFEEKYKNTSYTLDVNLKGQRRFLSIHDLNEPGSVYLDNDTLTLRCQIWKGGADFLGSENCYAHTKIIVSKLDYVWNLKDIAAPNNAGYKFKQTAEIPSFILGVPTLKMHVLNESSVGEDSIHFGIEMPNQTKDVFLVMMTHILDKVGKTVLSKRSEHFFECQNNKIWDFPLISKRKLYLNEQIYMQSGELTLQCEFFFSGNPEIISVAYRKTDITIPKSVSPDLSTDGYDLWKENLKRFFIEGEMSDLVVRTPKKEYPVHRAILCAQSKVFRTMLNTDMKEKNTGVIKIEDLEDDTVTELLSYLYTNTIEDLDSSAAQKLYYASDRYRIKSLKRICSNFLTRNLDISNVCETLLLADTHQDQGLKSCAKDFIQAHVQEIIDSDGWKSLMKANSSLTSEVMQRILCRKFLKVKRKYVIRSLTRTHPYKK